MGKILGFSCQTKPVAFDGFCKDHGGLALVGDRCGIGCIDFIRIVTTPVESRNLFIRKVRDHFGKIWMRAEKVLAHIAPIMAFVVLVVPVDRIVHPLLQQTLGILLE